ncbi:hypothetical protein [Streptomyces sp. OE57]|uniref:hypothetical protein n=1 Tax=Streptomyces lacaronensis TaxID=3379885 RepID=UPI0039B724F0
MTVPRMDGGALPWRQLSLVPTVLGVLRQAMCAERGVAETSEDVIRRDRTSASSSWRGPPWTHSS